MNESSSLCSRLRSVRARFLAIHGNRIRESAECDVTSTGDARKERCIDKRHSTVTRRRLFLPVGLCLPLAVGMMLVAPEFAHAESHSFPRPANPISETFVPQLPPGTTLRLRIVKGNLREAVQSRENSPSAFQKLAEESAVAYSLPIDYFVRLIRQESGFDPGVVSRTGAQGIAQFMPTTAVDRGLKDPFDPAEALPKSAELLSELKARFGNLGLAAAAYNAGPDRVRKWLVGQGRLPDETVNYVRAITGREVTDWASSSDPSIKPISGLEYGNPSRPKTIARRRHWEEELLTSIQSSSIRPANDHGMTDDKKVNLCPSCIVRQIY
jgi:hypothetical protein